MAIVRMPGSVVECILEEDKGKPPEEQSVFEIVVLDYDQWIRWERITSSLRTEKDTLKATRKLYAMGLQNVRNYKVMAQDGTITEFVLQKVGDEVTTETCSLLKPHEHEIIKMIGNAQTYGVEDAKN